VIGARTSRATSDETEETSRTNDALVALGDLAMEHERAVGRPSGERGRDGSGHSRGLRLWRMDQMRALPTAAASGRV